MFNLVSLVQSFALGHKYLESEFPLSSDLQLSIPKYFPDPLFL